MKKSNLPNCKTLDQERKLTEYLTEKKQKIENQIKINQILKDNDIRFPDDIDRMTWNSDKALLTYDGNEPTLYNFYVPFLLPKAPTSIIEIKHKDIKQGELFNIEVLDGTKEKVEQFNIETPTEDQLNHTRYNASLSIDYNYINSISSPDIRLPEIQRLRREQADKINHTEALNIYYRSELLNFNEKIKEEYIRNLSKQEVQAHYKRNNDKLYEDLETINNYLKFLINNELLPSRGLATPNDLRTATMGTRQVLKWRDIDKQHQDKVKDLLKSTEPEISDRLEDDENPDEVISQFIGIKLRTTQKFIQHLQMQKSYFQLYP